MLDFSAARRNMVDSQLKPNRVRDREQRDRALGILEDHGMVRQTTEGRKGMIEVNPSLTK